MPNRRRGVFDSVVMREFTVLLMTRIVTQMQLLDLGVVVTRVTFPITQMLLRAYP